MFADAFGETVAAAGDAGREDADGCGGIPPAADAGVEAAGVEADDAPSNAGIAAGFDAVVGVPAGGDLTVVRRLFSQSSRNEVPPAPAEAGAEPAGRIPPALGPAAGAAPVEPAPNAVFGAPHEDAAGRGAGFGVILVLMSLSTTARGLPYLAAESCLSASASRGFGVPSDGSVVILNGCVGTPPISVRTMVL